MKKIAIIDLGTNTFHLLIAEKTDGQANILHKDKASVKIGQGGINKSFINSDAYERALKTLRRFKEIIDQHGISEVYAFGTSAIRNARNGYEFVKDIKKDTGINVQVISGDKEAEYIYHGVRSALNLGKNISVVMDIGGGSVEFIICNQEKIFWKESFEIGGQRMLEMFHHTDPITDEEVEKIHQFLKEKLEPLVEAAHEYKPTALVGASGTFDTLCDIDVIHKNLNFTIEEEKEYTLQLNDFEKISAEIISKTREERIKIRGMAEMRVDMIVVACILIKYIIEELQVQKVRVSSYALKEGVLSLILKGENLNIES